MFQLFVVGPVPVRGGLIRQCMTCRAGREGAPRCAGFGPGCLVHTAEPPRAEERRGDPRRPLR